MNEAVRLGFDPLAPWTVLWVLAGASALVWAVYIIVGGRAWLMRALAFFFVVLGLSNPLWIKEQREPLKEIVALIRDRSESMRFSGRDEAAETAFNALKDQLEADDSVELRISETDPGADGTDLYSALLSALADAPRERIGGALLVTDGQVHDLPDDPDSLQQLGPIHGLIVGEEDERDRRIEIVSAPNFGIVGDRASITVRVDDIESAVVDVNISVNGQPLRARRAVTGVDTVISFDIPRRGTNLVVVETPAGENELTLANNRTAATISGVRDRLRVLLVTGEPHSGARLWRDLLKTDPSVDLVHFTILRPPNKQDPTPIEELALISFPTRELFVEKLHEFDLVIFDRYRRIGVLPMAYFDNVARYVADGGALLVSVGEPYAGRFSLYRTPLAGILPVRPSGLVNEDPFKPERTDLGARHTVTANLEIESQWGAWTRYIGGRALSGETVLQAEDGAPLLVLDRVDQGRVATLMSDQLWLWARGIEGGGPHSELIRRTAHWLMKEPELEEELLELRADGDEMIAELRTLTDDPPRLTLTDPDGVQNRIDWTSVAPGLFEARVAAPRLGLYTARAGDSTTVALNGPANPREYADVRSTTELLSAAGRSSGGGAQRIGVGADVDLPDLRWVSERANAIGEGWSGLKRRNAYAVRASQATSLLPGVIGAALVILLMMLAWRREGR